MPYIVYLDVLTQICTFELSANQKGIAQILNIKLNSFTMQNLKVPQAKVLEVFNFSRSHLHNLVNSGKVIKYKLAGKNFYDLNQISEAMEPQPVKGGKA